MSNTPQTSLWASIAETLSRDIGDGHYAPGDKLPTEHSLADRFGVNRHTVRRALASLVDQGLVRTRRGTGAFVLAKPTDFPLGPRVRFHENLLAAGRIPSKQRLSVVVRGASRGEAEALNITPEAAVCAYHGLSLMDGSPVGLFESVFPLDRIPGLDKVLETEPGVTAALRACGVPDYRRVSTRLTAVLATATQALHLQVDEGAPLLRTTSLNLGPDDLPVEYGRSHFASDRITLTLGDLSEKPGQTNQTPG